MLNSPTEGTAGEEFAENVLGRMNRGAGLNQELFGPREMTQAQREQAEARKQRFIARFSELTGLRFDATGKCLNPSGRMEGYREQLAQVCEEFRAQGDRQTE
jgi:hypothetical protein